jgi:hypothetical protein
MIASNRGKNKVETITTIIIFYLSLPGRLAIVTVPNESRKPPAEYASHPSIMLFLYLKE